MICPECHKERIEDYICSECEACLMCCECDEPDGEYGDSDEWEDEIDDCE